MKPEASALNSNRLAATLMCVGAVLGLVGATPTGFTLYFAVLGWASFGLVFLLGLLLFRKRPEGRLFAAAALWFALLGGAASVALLILGLMISWKAAIWSGSVGVLGTILAMAGAGIWVFHVRT